MLAAAARAIGRRGPARLTLADVAAEAGLAPSTLVQRFGSKQGLLVAVAEAGIAAVPGAFASAAASPSPLAAVVDALVGMAESVGDPDELANHLAFLQLELSDPSFRGSARTHARAVRREIATLLERGGVDPDGSSAHARAIQSAYNGALVTWAIDGEGSLGERVRADVERAVQGIERTG